MIDSNKTVIYSLSANKELAKDVMFDSNLTLAEDFDFYLIEYTR